MHYSCFYLNWGKERFFEKIAQSTRLSQSLLKGLVHGLEFLKKSWKLRSSFPDLKSWKMIISLEFRFGKLQQLLYKGKFFSFIVLVKYNSNLLLRLQRILKKSLFLRFLRSLLITYLITSNLKTGIIVLDKSLQKVLNFGSRNLYEPFAQS